MRNDITPMLWYNKEAEEAARFYASILPDSHVDSVATMPNDSPSGPPGSVVVVEFTLMGRPFSAMSAGPLDPFNHAISLMVFADTQEEIDKYWDALGAGGSYEPCGWLKDRFGLSWQVVPEGMQEMLRDPSSEGATRAMQAMFKMKKLDIAELRRAYAGESAKASA